MRIFRPTVRTAVALVTVQLGLLLSQPLATAVTFTITPSSVSNQYTGPITLRIGGLNTGEAVVVQEFLDINTNGIVDAGDWPVQSFQLTDGQSTVIGGVTNVNVPGDSNPTNGSITAQLDFPPGGWASGFVGQYIYVLSSPTNRFASITNLFTVTNSTYPQSFTGTVQSGGTNLPYATVVLVVGGPGGFAAAGAVANSSGTYTINATPGTYLLWAVKSNYVAGITTAPTLTLNPNATITNNLNLIPATQSISASVVDTNTPAIGLPGILVAWKSTNNLIAIGFTDRNGNCTIPVTASQWTYASETGTGALDLHGYVPLQSGNGPTVDTTIGNVIGATVALSKETALFYGNVTDAQNHPLAGVHVFATDDNGVYDGDSLTDTNGYYVMAVLGETDEGWTVGIDNSAGVYTNYVFNSAYANILDGQAILLNFVGQPLVFPIPSSLVLNGGFETGNFTDWTLSGPDTNDIFVDDGSGSGIQPLSGNYLAALGSVGALSYLSQTLATTAGATYSLSLWLDSPDGVTPNEFLVSWNGITLLDQTNIGAIGWTNIQFKVTATGPSTVLLIGGRDDNSYLGLDDISVVPATLAITGITLSGTNLVLNGANGLSGATYNILTSTNLALPLNQWTPISTNVLNGGGNFTIIATNAVNRNLRQSFYILQQQ
jgi:hypothetical protein